MVGAVELLPNTRAADTGASPPRCSNLKKRGSPCAESGVERSTATPASCLLILELFLPLAVTLKRTERAMEADGPSRVEKRTEVALDDVGESHSTSNIDSEGLVAPHTLRARVEQFESRPLRRERERER